MNDFVIRVEPDVRLVVYVTSDDLEYNKDIKRIRDLEAPMSRKIELAREVVKEIAMEKLVEAGTDYLRDSDVEIKDFDNFEITFERIDWDWLLSKEEE